MSPKSIRSGGFIAQFPAAILVVAAASLGSLSVSGQEGELPDVPKEQFHIFLLAGQSNMAGRGTVEEEDRQANPRVFMLTREDQWRPAVDPMHFDKPQAGVGLGRAFGIAVAEANPGVIVGLVPAAVGGSPISTWQPGGVHRETNTAPYDDAIRRVRVALERGVLKGILWHQGESDSTPQLVPAYERGLHDLVARFRRDLEAPDVSFIVGQLGKFDDRPWDEARAAIDAVHRAIPESVAHAAFVSAAGLPNRPGEEHFNSAGYREFGKRYAKAYLDLVAPPSPSQSSPSPQPSP